MLPSASPRRRSLERGAFTWVTFLMLLVLLAGGYLAVVWGPIYILRYEVGVVTGEFANRAVNKLAALGQVKVQETDGTISEVRAVDLRPEDITWERKAETMPRSLRIAFEYTTSIHYPVIDRFSEKTFAIELERDISPVKW
jgi:hypothetical protein